MGDESQPSLLTNKRLLVATMLASTSAGMLARIPMHPVDTCKAKMQVQVSSTKTELRTFRAVFSSTLRAEGIRGLYQGFGAAFLGSAPAGCLYFTSFEYSKKWLSDSFSWARSMPSAAHFSAGLIAEALSCVAWVPIDVVKERLQVQSSMSGPLTTGYGYKGSWHAARTIVKMEGISGLYRGYGATLASFGPFSALYFVGYEKCKSGYSHLHWLLSKPAEGTQRAAAPTPVPDSSIPLPYVMFSGAVSGACASFLTNPLDISKLRLQVQRGTAAHAPNSVAAFPFHYSNTVDGVVQITRLEGPRGLFKGAGARMLFHAPSTAIAIVLYEGCKRFFTGILGQ